MAADHVQLPTPAGLFNRDMAVSLSILLPHLNINEFRQESRRTSQDITSHNPIARELERISNDWIMALSNRDFDTMMRIAERHIAPDYQSWIDNYVAGRTFPEYFNNLKHMTTDAPKLQVRVLEASAEVDDESGRATVYQLLEVTGRPEHLRRITVCMVLWRRRRSQWESYQCRTVRGLPGSGVVGDL